MNYEKIYHQLIDRSKNRVLESYTEKHHIIPKCIGGNDDASNIAILTPREHFLAHWLLHEMYPKNFKLKFAFVMMTNVSNKLQSRYIPSSRVYEYAKKCMIELNKDVGKLKIGKKYPKLSESKRGYKFSEESKKRMSDSQKNMSFEKRFNISNSQKNMMWITNGIIDKRVKKDMEIPIGFRIGRVYRMSDESRESRSNKLKKMYVGGKNPSAKKVFQYTKNGEFINSYDTVKEAVIKTGISKISSICNGHKTHKDFIFSYTPLLYYETI